MHCTALHIKAAKMFFIFYLKKFYQDWKILIFLCFNKPSVEYTPAPYTHKPVK